MLMVMDIGNTNIVVGVHDGKEWIAHWRLSSSRSRTSDEFGIIQNDNILAWMTPETRSRARYGQTTSCARNLA